MSFVYVRTYLAILRSLIEASKLMMFWPTLTIVIFLLYLVYLRHV